MADGSEKCNGGDARFDVYLADWFQMVRPDFVAQGININYRSQFTCDERPSFVLLREDLVEEELELTLAHEMAHAIIAGLPLGKPCDEYRWLNEATGMWAEDFVYGAHNTEHSKAKHFLRNPTLPLESDDLTSIAGIDRAYGSYLWLFYLSHTRTPKIIPAIWAAAATKDALTAIDSSINGGFRDAWSKFSALLWNLELSSPFKEDLLTGQAQVQQDFLLEGKQPKEILTFRADVQHLAAHYYRFSFSAASPDVRSVGFYSNTRLQDISAGARVTAQIKLAGQDWSAEDWTDSPGVSPRLFCRDFARERLEELVIIVSNSQFSDRTSRLQPDEDSRLTVTNVGCWRWSGKVSRSRRVSTDPSLNTDVSATVTLDRLADDRLASRQGIEEMRFTVSGTGTVQALNAIDKFGCTVVREQQTAKVTPKDVNLWLFGHAVDTAQDRTYAGTVDALDGPTQIVTCQNTPPETMKVDTGALWAATDTLGPTGDLMQGMETLDNGNETITFSWDLRAQRQP